MFSRSLIKPVTSIHHVALCAKIAPAVEVRSISYLAQLRRERDGRLCPPQFTNDADEWIIHKDKRILGSEHTLNSTFANYKIDIDNLAYRNLHPRALITLANDRTRASKTQSSDNYRLVYGEKAPASDASSPNVIPVSVYKEVVRELKSHFSHAEQMFMHDGAIGSHSKHELRLRAMTDSASSALYLHHIISKVNIKDVQDFKHSLTLYIAPDFTPSNTKALGIKEGEAFVLVDVARGIAIVTGTQSTVPIRDALSAVSGPSFLRDFGSVALHADVVNVKGQEKPLLVINPDNILLNQELGEDIEVVGAHNAVWGDGGVYRFFDGITKPYSSSASVRHHSEKVASAERYTSRKQGNVTGHSHPSSVVILVSDHSKVLPPLSVIAPENVKDYLAAGYSGTSKEKAFKPLFSNTNTVDVHEASDRFNSLLSASKATVYVVNTAGKEQDMTGQDISAVLRAVAEGKAKATDSKSSLFQKLSPITSIQGLNVKLDSKTIQEEASKLEELISQKIASYKPKSQ